MASPAVKCAKRRWVKPELIVLVRGRPEEAVLWACKEFNYGGTNPGGQFNSCLAWDSGCVSTCDQSAGS